MHFYHKRGVKNYNKFSPDHSENVNGFQSKQKESNARLRQSRICNRPKEQLVIFKNSKGKHTASIKFGKYTADGVICKEALINGKCLRIPVKEINKKEITELLNKEERKVKVKTPPKKAINSQIKNTVRITRTNTLSKKTSRLSEKVNKLSVTRTLKKQNNGSPIDPSRISVHGRIRTPNKRYSNFIVDGAILKSKVGANLKVKRQRTMNSDSEVSENRDPLHIPLKDSNETDPLSVSDGDTKCDVPVEDEVKSFLPVTTVNEPLINESVSDKENDPLKIDNDPLRIDSEILEDVEPPEQPTEFKSKVNGQVPPLRTYSNKRLRKSPAPTESEQKKIKVTNEDADDLEALLSSDIKPKVDDLNFPSDEPKPTTQNSNQSSDIVKESDEVEPEKKCPPEKTVLNGKVNDDGIIYSLLFRGGRPGRKKILKNNLGFEKLVHQLKLIKLPAPHWKIRIFVTRDQQISEITFTNKAEKERCVKFSRSSISYSITFNSKPVSLVGAPVNIDTCADITMLLDIVHNLDENDPLIEYIASTK